MLPDGKNCSQHPLSSILFYSSPFSSLAFHIWSVLGVGWITSLFTLQKTAPMVICRSLGLCMPDSSVWLCYGTHINIVTWYLEEGKRGCQSLPLFYTPCLGVHNSALQGWTSEGRRSAHGCVWFCCGNPFLIQFLAHGQKENILEWLPDSKLLNYWNVAE